MADASPTGQNHMSTTSHRHQPWQLLAIVAIALVLLSHTQLPAAETAELQRYLIDTTLVGYTRPVTEMVVSAEVNARCIMVNVEEGEAVPASGLVAELDNTFVEIDLKKNRIAQQQARHRLEQERKNLARYTSLINRQSAAQATFDQAELQAQLIELNLQDLVTEEQRLLELLGRHSLFAPEGWQVMDRSIEPGEYVHAGEPLLTVGDFRRLIVPFQLTYEQLQAVDNNEKLSLELPELGLQVRAGLYKVAANFDPLSRKIPIELMITPQDYPGFRARGGLKARLALQQLGGEQTYTIDSRAIINRYEASWLVSEEGGTQRVILLGKSLDGKTAVISGEGLVPGNLYQLNPDPRGMDSTDGNVVFDRQP